MSESLPVELNGESVHAVEAPETFTADGPFHLELRNAGGAAHVHVHLSDGLATAVRIGDVNHYVEGGETVRVPVGTVSDRTAVGYLEVVSGYGAERERVEVTVGSTSTGDAATRDVPEHDRTPSDRDTPGTAPSSRSDGEAAAAGTARSSRRHSGGQSAGGEAASEEKTAQTADGETRATPTGGETRATPTAEEKIDARTARSGGGDTAGGARIRWLPADPTTETVAFAVLAAVAVVVGVAVIVTVREPLLSVVVAGVVAAAVAVVGWLLFE